MMHLLSTASALALAVTSASAAFDLSKKTNMVAYWGQDSYCSNGGTSNCQKPIGDYCGADTPYDALLLSFLTVAEGTGGYPEIDLSNTCNANDNATFSGTALINCSDLATGIKKCQNQGVAVLMSLGGYSGDVAFGDNATASAFGDQLWNLFLGGSDPDRPFGDAVLDGLDLDIEGGTPQYYSPMIAQLRTHFAGDNGTYYLSAAPQCPFPDAYLGTALNAEPFDFVNVQFYNNACGVSVYNTSAWDYASWDEWAQNTSPNPNTKIMIGAPAAAAAANPGSYVDAATLGGIWQATASNSSALGGIMLWDVSQAEANGDYASAVKAYETGSANSVFRPKSLFDLKDVERTDKARLIKRTRTAA